MEASSNLKPGKHNSSSFLIRLLIVSALFLVACGGSGSSDDSSMTTTDDEVSQEISTGPIRVMPIGDSITEGQNGWNTYRYYLWTIIQANGLTVDFVGSRNGVLGGNAPNPDFDQDHEGHFSWRTDELLDYGFEIWSVQYPCDVAMIHLGTNDMREGRSVGQTLANFTRIIELLRAANPKVVVLLAQIIPSSRNNAEIEALNAAIPGYTQMVSTEESPVIPVDHHTGFSKSADLRDGVHPNDRGEQKMAGVWFNALAPYLIPQ